MLKYDVLDGDERWLVLDTDHYIQGTHVASFMEALRAAKQAGVRVALSRPCFEIWVLLHHIEETAALALADCAAVTTELKRILGAYNKTRLLADHFPLKAVTEACARAKRLHHIVGGGDIPLGNTSRVFEIWQSICQFALPSQLPEELRALASTLDGIP